MRPFQEQMNSLASELEALRMQECVGDEEMEAAANAEKRKAAQGSSPERKKAHTGQV